MSAARRPEGAGPEAIRRSVVRISAALVHLALPAHGFAVLKPDVAPPGGHANCKRVQ